MLVRLREEGVRARTTEPVDIPVGSYAGGKAAYVFDPDGVEIELIERGSGDA
jgi:catechol 2,3-dioxygenase-like lactoylglutathione lyase family enzyme